MLIIMSDYELLNMNLIFTFRNIMAADVVSCYRWHVGRGGTFVIELLGIHSMYRGI